MKKVTAIVLALLMVLSLAACGSAASESKTLVMATSADYPPYEFIVLNDKNEQQYVGIDVSVSEAIAADMGKELQVVNMDFDSLMAGLRRRYRPRCHRGHRGASRGRRFLRSLLHRSASDDPRQADKAGEYTSIESFSGKSVGAQTGTTKADLVTSDMPGANLVGLTSVNDLVNQLVYDKVDAIVVDGAVAQQYAKSNSDLVVADVSLGEAFPYCVAVQKGDPKGLLPSINATIAKLIADGKIEQYIADAEALSDQAIG